MKLLYGVLLFAGVFALINGSTTVNTIATNKLLMTSLLSAPANDPNNAMQCFVIYIPEFTRILDQYNASYEKCGSDASAQQDALDLQAQGNKTLILAGAQSICSSMTTCSAEEQSLAFLDCFSSIGDGNVKSLYVLTNNASDIAASLRESLRVIQNNLAVCQNNTERTYVEDTAKANEALNYCFANGTPAPPATTTDLPESTTTEEPSTTEGPSTTEEPSTTDAPSSSDEPSTTEEPTTPAAAPAAAADVLSNSASEMLSLNKFNRSSRK